MSFSKVKGSNTPNNALLIPNNLSDVANANTSLNNILPSQTGNNGKALVTNGSNTSWQTIQSYTFQSLPILADGQTLFTLSAIPTNNSLVILILNGYIQVLGIDFVIVGSLLTWLEYKGVVLETSDFLRILF